MFTNNTTASVANQVQQRETGLFTYNLQTKTNTQAFQASSQKPGLPVAAAAAPSQRSFVAPSMSLGDSKMQKMGFTNAANSSSFFGEQPASVKANNQYSEKADTVPQANQKLNMSMFGAPSNATSSLRPAQPQFLSNLGHQVNMSKQMGGTRTRSSSITMMAGAATVEGEAKQDVKEGHMDRVFLQQKYDNADHLDPVIKYEGLKYTEELMKNAKLLSAPGKGILASDESNGTCGKRFEAINVENTEENRRAYRELLYTVDGLEEFVSGAIMFDETIKQSDSNGTPFAKLLMDKGILTGIKVDTGISVIEGTNDETVTNGLDGLSQRASEYYKMGARFAKWRAVLKITDDGCPSEVAITETAHSLARYAQICQHAGLVPIVEPEILTDGTHDIKKCARVSEKVFNAVMNEVITQKIMLEGMLLKPNMITSGAQAEVQAGPEEVAFFTVRTLARTIPPAVPGITFLSGGQSEETACQNLSAINKLAEIKHPWSMTYSFGRALQSSVLTTWMGKEENVEAAQKRLYERCQAASSAALGKYEGGQGSTQSDYVANYVY